jgi:hypothetical protein
MTDPLSIVSEAISIYESKTLRNFISYNFWDKFYYGLLLKNDFYFKSYTKHVTIYRNGNGIIKNDFIIRVINDDSFSEFNREIDISDAKKGTSFPPLDEMLNLSICDRFSNKFGFWYDCEGSKSHNLISSIEQKQSGKKTLKWTFHFDKAVLKGSPHKIFNLSYAISIPNMFPIENGHTDKPKLPQRDYKFGSSLQVWHKMSSINYIISFEKGIDIQDIKCYNQISNNGSTKKRPLHVTYDRDIFYDKYILSYKRPKLHSEIEFNWDLKN